MGFGVESIRQDDRARKGVFCPVSTFMLHFAHAGFLCFLWFFATLLFVDGVG